MPSERGVEGRRAGKLVVLIGSHGMARSTQLRQIARETAERSLGPGVKCRTIPVYVDLAGYPNVASGLGNRLEALMRDSLREFWPELTAAELSDLLECRTESTLRILFDGSDDLPDRLRRQAWQEAQAMAGTRRHDCVLAITPSSFDPQRLKDADDLLIIQPLSRSMIQQFLTNLGEPARRLGDRLREKQLFDLAANPWLLVRMLDQARKGIYPASRHRVLCELVEEEVAGIPTEHGMRSHADQTLNRLAWEMQWARSGTWKMKDALRMMAEVRGNREYNLEELFDALVQCDLLDRVGEEEMRFAFPAIQAYCCARAIAQMDDRDRILDDITASLGHLDRLRWWEETLVLLSGLLGESSGKLNPVLQALAFGTNLTQGEQVYLAVQCLLESGVAKTDQTLIGQVLDALVWQLDSGTEPRSAPRVRAIRALGQLRQPASIPYLARVANQKVRVDSQGALNYELSYVRMAACVALLGMMPACNARIQAADVGLADYLQVWKEEKVADLESRLSGGEVGLQSIAAFALGHLKTDEAVNALIDAFLSPDTERMTRWAVTDALCLLDPGVVLKRIILPLLDEKEARRRGELRERLALLIGRIGIQSPIALKFLRDCLKESTSSDVLGYTIQSLGWLKDYAQKELFEQIALGKPNPAKFGFGKDLVADPTTKSAWFLRRKAIEALAEIGDGETVERLNAGRELGWPFQLQQALYQTSERIAWRTSLGESRGAEPQARTAWLRLLRAYRYDPF